MNEKLKPDMSHLNKVILQEPQVIEVALAEVKKAQELPASYDNLKTLIQRFGVTLVLMLLLALASCRDSEVPYFDASVPEDDRATLFIPDLAFPSSGQGFSASNRQRTGNTFPHAALAGEVMGAAESADVVQDSQKSNTHAVQVDSELANYQLVEPQFVHGGIHFVGPKPVTFTFDTIQATENLRAPFDGIETTFMGIEYQRNVTAEAFQDGVFIPGEGTAGVTEDKYGNTIVYVHSGYIQEGSKWLPLEAEELRDALEGYGEFSNQEEVSSQERDTRLRMLEGATVHGSWNGVLTDFTIRAAGFIPHEGVKAFSANTADILDATIAQTGGELSSFAALEGKRVVFVVFCGWGPASHPESTTYSRYILALEPVPQEVTQAEIAFAQHQIDPQYAEYADYMINLSHNPAYGRSLAEGSWLIPPRYANPAIARGFSVHAELLLSTLENFFPEASPEQLRDFLDNYPLVLGPSADKVLNGLSKGSDGTAIPQVHADGSISFAPIAFSGEALQAGRVYPNLVAEEVLQALQSNEFALLYNIGYLAEVAGVSSPEHTFAMLREGRARSFIEIIQKQFLYENGLTGNSYAFMIGNQVSTAGGLDADSVQAISASFEALHEIIESVMGRKYTALELMNAETIFEINEAFRDHYEEFFNEAGIPDSERNIWDVTGMSRLSNGQGQLVIEPAFVLP